MKSSLVPFISTLIGIIIIFSLGAEFLIIALNRVPLLVSAVIFMVFWNVILRPFCIGITASHASAIPNVYAQITGLTTPSDVLLAYSTRLELLYLSVMNIFYSTLDDLS